MPILSITNPFILETEIALQNKNILKNDKTKKNLGDKRREAWGD
jgi:hypothetical protein